MHRWVQALLVRETEAMMMLDFVSVEMLYLFFLVLGAGFSHKGVRLCSLGCKSRSWISSAAGPGRRRTRGRSRTSPWSPIESRWGQGRGQHSGKNTWSCGHVVQLELPRSPIPSLPSCPSLLPSPSSLLLPEFFSFPYPSTFCFHRMQQKVFIRCSLYLHTAL